MSANDSPASTDTSINSTINNTINNTIDKTDHPDGLGALDGLARWHQVALTNDEAKVLAILADDAVFESPVVHTPQVGKAITAKYLASAGQVFTDSGFQYVGEWRSERSAVLEFKAVVDGIAINGIDMISWNDEGLITNFKVMVRPLKGMNMLHAKMGEMLTTMTARP
jgi:hypothetical protein